MSSGKVTREKSLSKESQTVCYLPPQFTVTLENSSPKDLQNAIKAWLVQSLEDSPANHSASPESSGELMTKEICGRQPQTLFGLSSLDPFCLKTCPEFAHTCPWSSETCVDLGMTFSDPYSLGLTIAEGRTEERGCGLWRTPDAGTHGNVATPSKCLLNGTARKEQQVRLVDQVTLRQMWPTPRAGKTTDENEETWLKRHTEGKVSTPPLTLAVKIWPTPQNRDFRTGEGHRWLTPEERSRNLNGAVANSVGYKIEKNFSTPSAATEQSGQLNPDWVEALMGWPTFWTSISPLSKETFNHWLENHQWEDWEPDIPRVAKGIKDRVNRMEAIGNGQVPICAATAWRILGGRVKC